ncbi:MAG: P-II family nitrogen regulator [Clostridia bacterium]|nr:P-II family nitrogen regulator [Clostridia bacterium]
MSAVELFVLIVPRDLTDGYGLYFREAGIRTLFSFPCGGTAGAGILSRLGLEKNEKTLFLAVMDRKGARKLMNGCVTDMGLKMSGNGIAMIVPMQAVGGATALKVLADNMPIDPDEVKPMDKKPTFPCSLLVAICEKDHSDEVMAAAIAGGAGGGTVIHAKGTAGETMKKFLGVSLATEKEMVLILVRRETRDAVMRRVMDLAGVDTPAHTIMFALPVEETAGVRSLEAPAETPGKTDESADAQKGAETV